MTNDQGSTNDQMTNGRSRRGGGTAPSFVIRCSAFVLLSSLPAAHAVEGVIDSVMDTDPDIPAARVVKVFPGRLTELWLRALERPENDMKCQAAAAIALAHRRGMPGLHSTVTPL